jgi:serine/threonine protein phosphatase PrpC
MISTKSTHFPVFAATDPGMSGKNNEDNYGVSAYVVSESDPTASIVAIVADGVGGHQAGEVASSIAVDMISQLIAESDADHPLATMEGAFHRANQAIYSQATINPASAGMSTTAACVWIIGDQLYLASMGDSRIYLKRGDQFSQLTIDHTWVQEAIESGVLARDQARSHPNAHLIRRYLGSKQPSIPDFRINHPSKGRDQQSVANQGMHLKAGDYLLLCSDGLTDLVSDDEIYSALGKHPLEEVLDRLIKLANSRGGHDNITIIGIQIPDDKEIVSVPKRRNRFTIVLVLFSVLVIAIMATWFYRMYFWEGDSNTATQVPGGTAGLGIPMLTQTAVLPTLPPPTPEFTPLDSPSPLASSNPTAETTLPATYTPWPTSTTGP